MALPSIISHGLIGDVIRFPFSVIYFVIAGIIKILLIPFRVLWFLLMLPIKLFQRLYPEIYIDNLIHSFKFLWCGFRSLFMLASFVLLFFLVPIYLLFLFISHRTLQSFNLLQSAGLLGSSFVVTELVILLLLAGAFLLTCALVFILISGYSTIETGGEVLDEIISRRIVWITMFCVAALIVIVLYGLLHLVAGA